MPDPLELFLWILGAALLAYLLVWAWGESQTED